MNAQGKTYWDNANTYSQKMYFVMGAHCDIDFSKMSISIWGKTSQILITIPLLLIMQ